MSDQPFDPLFPFGRPEEEEEQPFDPLFPFGRPDDEEGPQETLPMGPSGIPQFAPRTPVGPPDPEERRFTDAPPLEEFPSAFPGIVDPEGPLAEAAAGVPIPAEDIDPRFRELRDLGIEANRLVTLLGPADTEVVQMRQQIDRLRQQLQNDYPGLSQSDFDRMASDPVGLGRRIGQIATSGLMHTSDILEPLQIPWQLAMRGVQAQLESANRGDNFWQTLRAIGNSFGDVQYDLALDRYGSFRTFFTGRQRPAGDLGRGEGDESRLMTDIVTYRDILNQVGADVFIEQDLGLDREGTANKMMMGIFGFAGDMLVDPLNAAPFVGGFKRIAQGLGFQRAGDSLQALQTGVERLTSPLGIAGTARQGARLLPGGRTIGDYVEGMAERGLRAIMDFEILPTTQRRAGVSLGSVFQPRQDRLPFGEELVRTERQADLTATELIDFINDRVEAVYNTFGEEPTRRWLGQQFSAMNRVATAPQRAANFPQELQDLLMTALVDTADSTGILSRPGALDIADDFLVRESAQLRTGPLGVAQTGASVGEELRTLRSAFPDQANLVHSRYTERITEVANRLNVDPNTALRAFEDMLDEVVAADAVAGWHQSLFPQFKELFFQRAMSQGANANQAGELWLRSWSTVLRGGNLNEVIFEVPSGVNVQNIRMPNSQVRGGQIVTDVERMLSLPDNIAQLNFEDYMRAVGGGHLRRTFGTVIDLDQFEAYRRQMEHGMVATSRIINEAAVETALRGGVGQDVADLVTQYIETIAPNNPLENGFLIRQNNLVQHLLDNGIEARRANQAIANIIGTANPHLQEWADDVSQMLSNRFEVQSGRTGPATGRAVTGRRNVELTAEQLDELGRMFDAGTALRETTIAATGQYSQNRFVHDVWRVLNQEGWIMAGDTPAASRPRGYVRMPNVQGIYGQLADQWVPRWVQREVFNATRNQTPPGLVSTYARVRSAVTGAWLASPTANQANLVGGFVSAMQYGFNPATLMDEMINVMWESRGGALRTGAGRAAREAGGVDGLRSLPEFREMGELLSSTGLTTNEFGRHFDAAKLEQFIGGFDFGTSDGMRRGINAIGGLIAQEGQQFLQNPARLGPLKRLPPGTTNAVGFVGLDGFEYIENLFKIAAYRVRRNQGFSQARAYRDARLLVFDYADVPQALQVVRQTGIPPFAAFPVFATARTLRTSLERPGIISVLDRSADSLWQNMIPDDETRNSYYNTLEEWQRNGKYVPFRFRQGPTGDNRDVASMWPFNELFVSTPWAGNPLAEGFLSAGVMRWAVDLITAYSNGSGEAAISGRFGQQVFEQDADGTERRNQTLRFLYNSLAPGFARKLFTFGQPGEENEGLLPFINQDFLQGPVLDLETAEALDQIRQLSQGREERDLWERVFTLAIRSAHPVSIDPATNPVIRDLSLQDFEDQQLAGQIRNRIRDIWLADMDRDSKIQALIDAYAPAMEIRVNDAARLLVVLEGMEPPEEGR